MKLVYRMGLIERGEGMQTMSAIAPLETKTFHLMGMIVRRSSKYVLTLSAIEQHPESGKDESEEEFEDGSSSSSSPSLAAPLKG